MTHGGLPAPVFSAPVFSALVFRLALLLVLIPVVGPAQPAPPERRVALVIGVGAYQSAPQLANPVGDARSIGESLRRLNFEVEEVLDPDFRRITRALREFGIRAQRADVALVYYAGHGVQVGRENYLLPADAKLERERDLLYEALPLELLLGEASQAARLGIVLLDACRNNPFVDRMSRSMTIAGRGATSPGLARVDNVPRNTLVVMATKADQIAEDGSGSHSPFAEALLAHFQIPGLELSLFFRSVRDTVLRATGNRQEPFIFSSLGAEPFYFYPGRRTGRRCWPASRRSRCATPPGRPPCRSPGRPTRTRTRCRSASPACRARGGADRRPPGHPRRGLRRRPLRQRHLQAGGQGAGAGRHARHPGRGRPRRQRDGKPADQRHRLQPPADRGGHAAAADLHRPAGDRPAGGPGRGRPGGHRPGPAARPGPQRRRRAAPRRPAAAGGAGRAGLPARAGLQRPRRQPRLCGGGRPRRAGGDRARDRGDGCRGGGRAAGRGGALGPAASRRQGGGHRRLPPLLPEFRYAGVARQRREELAGPPGPVAAAPAERPAPVPRPAPAERPAAPERLAMVQPAPPPVRPAPPPSPAVPAEPQRAFPVPAPAPAATGSAISRTARTAPGWCGCRPAAS
ncbi:caspase domain-containing protein [Paeniroseomonas aquatica]|uniref:caspase family protein n=1 Tax=Paeniroseomonas aquatica TaxID=373043 RepID=UPI003609E8B3